jgi:alpha-glucosidase
MISKLARFILLALLSTITLSAMSSRTFKIKSINGNITLTVNIGSKITWSLQEGSYVLIAPSAIALELEDGEVLGDSAVVLSSNTQKVDTEFKAINYVKAEVPNEYERLTINFKGDFGLVFRVYNNAAAYRFFTKRIGEITIKNEEANFNFTDDDSAFIPYMRDYRDNKIFNCSFESHYTQQKISEFKKDSLAFLPVLVDEGNGEKVVILEADLENYPGMFLDLNSTAKGFKGVYAPYPLKSEHIGLNFIPMERADYIAKVNGTREFPWRVVVISKHDKDLLNSDIIQQLASPPRIKDISWIKPGQVAWDWWNDWNISHVNFKSGINTATYKYYIDFAAANHISYIIMDAGWSAPNDLSKTIVAINLPEIINYGKQKRVGVILWTTWYDLLQQMDQVFPMYSKMGVKGFKIDFFDRDDQKVVASTYEIAKKAAEYHLMVDFHGIYKPTGLQRTYPNVIGYEGVQGMEYEKWSNDSVPAYDVSIPFIRMMAGPMDYTPGAMRNAAKGDFRPINSMPMSQGTRCHQLAMYVIFYAPLQMLSDNPTIYMKEQECTNFITKVPTTFDETVPLAGEVGEYDAIARRKGNTWFAGAMTNWDARDLTLDFSFLKKGKYKAVVFEDGINSDRDGTDYKREVINISADQKLKVHLAPGGGWAARIERVN